MAAVSNIFVLFLLYFGQGLPYGFQVKLLPLFLRSQNISLSKVSLSRLLSAPWIFKFALAPFVDSLSSLRSWIVCGLLGMTAFCLTPAFFGVSNTFILLICIFGMNLTSAAQDVAVDLLAINFLQSSDLGIGSILQVVGYKIGILFGGGLLALLAVSCGWELLFLLWGCFYIALVVLMLCRSAEYAQSSFCQSTDGTTADNTCVLGSIDQDGTDILHNTSVDKSPTRNVSNLDISRILQLVLETPHYVWLLIYVSTYKLGEQGIASMFPLYVLDLGYSQDQVAVMFGVFGQLSSIIGSSVGGWIVHCHRSGRSWVLQILLWASYARLIPLSVQWMLALVPTFKPSLPTMITLECLVQFISGVITTAAFTLIMLSTQNSAPGTKASNSAILATAEVLGKLLMISFSGILADFLGYQSFFGLCLCFACLTIPVLKAGNGSPNKKLL